MFMFMFTGVQPELWRHVVHYKFHVNCCAGCRIVPDHGPPPFRTGAAIRRLSRAPRRAHLIARALQQNGVCVPPLPPTHTCAHTHTQKCVCACTRTPTRRSKDVTCEGGWTRHTLHTHTYTHTHTLTYTHTHTHTHSRHVHIHTPPL
jgi:hypothetical protein